MRCVRWHRTFSVEPGIPRGFLYGRVVILRSDKLIHDVANKPCFAAGLAVGTFDVLFRLNLRSRGWQNIAVAKLDS
jgi:hypothetical protein